MAKVFSGTGDKMTDFFELVRRIPNKMLYYREDHLDDDNELLSEYIINFTIDDLTATDKNGYTPLQALADVGNIDMIELLCEEHGNNIDINHRLKSGHTVFTDAIHRGHYHVAETLAKYFDDIDILVRFLSDEFYISESDNYTTLLHTNLSRRGCEILASDNFIITPDMFDVKDSSGDTPLISVSKYDDCNLIHYFEHFSNVITFEHIKELSESDDFYHYLLYRYMEYLPDDTKELVHELLED